MSDFFSSLKFSFLFKLKAFNYAPSLDQNEYVRIHLNLCPISFCVKVDGQWSAWSHYSTCSKTCGGGTRTHQRTCSNPAPLYGGMTCHGNDTETEICNQDPCPGPNFYFIVLFLSIKKCWLLINIKPFCVFFFKSWSFFFSFKISHADFANLFEMCRYEITLLYIEHKFVSSKPLCQVKICIHW